MLVHISEQYEHQIEALAQALLNFTNLLDTLIKYNPTLIFARLHYQESSFEVRQQALVDTLHQLQPHKLTIKFCLLNNSWTSRMI
jgi:hypothetical protein